MNLFPPDDVVQYSNSGSNNAWSKIKKLFEKLTSLRRYTEGERAIFHRVYHTRFEFAYTLLKASSAVDFVTFKLLQFHKKFLYSSFLTRFRIRNWWKVSDNFNENWSVLGDMKKFLPSSMSNWHNLSGHSFIAFSDSARTQVISLE